MSEYTLKTIRELGSRRPDEEQRIIDENWPEFLMHDPIGDDYYMRLYRNFPDYQFVLYDGETMVAACNSIPVIWNLDPDHLFDAGWDWALESGFHNFQFEQTPTTMCAISITVAKAYKGKGISGQLASSQSGRAKPRATPWFFSSPGKCSRCQVVNTRSYSRCTLGSCSVP